VGEAAARLVEQGDLVLQPQRRAAVFQFMNGANRMIFAEFEAGAPRRQAPSITNATAVVARHPTDALS
jgi:hypothetical protein